MMIRRRAVRVVRRGGTPRWRIIALSAAAAVLIAASGGCAGIQSMVDPQGPQAARIAWLWWVFFGVCTAVFLAVTTAVLLALFRPNRTAVDPGPAPPDDGGKRRVVAVSTGATVVILAGFFAADLSVGMRMTTVPPSAAPPIVVEVIGHQWWWEVHYRYPSADRSFKTANEIRIPVGRPVVVQARSRDVIHSFWVPNLHGKIDLVPGRVNTMWLQADRAGVFRGQCAEFCGLQHAKMAFMVVAVPPEAFDAWAEASRRPAPVPEDAPALRGQQVFVESQCSLCHTIRGTGAWGQVAPDLTRLAERRTIAAGTLPNTRGNLAAWIVDPQHVKPGNFMPPTSLEPEELRSLVAYLETLR